MFFENQYILKNDQALAGSDEVGRGPLAGPVVASTVVLTDFKSGLGVLKKYEINDSKVLKEKKREEILEALGIDISKIKPNKKIELKVNNLKLGYFSVVEIQADEIDELNILQASLKAMRESLLYSKGRLSTGAWLIDGNRMPDKIPGKWRASTIIKGDSHSMLIGLASIIAKQYRDLLMKVYAEKYPGYGLEKHSGYPTKFHREAISIKGPSPIHRKSFKGVKEFL